MTLKKDLQAEQGHAYGNIPINKVGIVNVQKRVDIGKRYVFTPHISALIRLPGTQRGIHMSRTAETIEEVVNEVVFLPAKSFEEVCHRIAKSLLEYHDYTDFCEVEMKGDVIVPARGEDAQGGTRAFRIHTKAKGYRNSDGGTHYRVFVGSSAEGITACPCAQEMSREFTEEILKNRKDINITPEQLEKLFTIIPLATHNQRATGSIMVEVPEDTQHYIDIIDIVKVIEQSMSASIRSILKRPDEAELVRTAHLNPKFVEDVVRTMGKRLATDPVFATLPDKFTARCQITSYESIHTHNAYAELKASFGDLRKAFRNGPD